MANPDVSKISCSPDRSGLLKRRAAVAVGILLVAATAGGGFLWWRGHHGRDHYVTAAVSRGAVQRTVTMTGALNPVVTVQVGSYVSGTIKTLFCDYNTEVKIGQVCAKVDPQPYQVVVDQDKASLDTGIAQLKKDRAAQDYTVINYQRDQKLLEQGIVSQDTVDSDRSAYEQGEAQLVLDQATNAQRQAALEAAQVNLAYTDILSPVNGTVITRSVDVGQTVVSSTTAATLFLIGKDLTKMQVDTNVSEADIGSIRLGQKAYFTVQAYPEKTFTGNVTEIRKGPITVQNVVTYDIVVAVDNPELLLLPGMTADTHIITAESNDVLRVPLPSVRFTPEGLQRIRTASGGGRSGRGSRVWVMRGGVLTPVPVTTGLDDGTLIEVKSDSLAPGDQVVVNEARPAKADAPTNQQRRFGPRL